MESQVVDNKSCRIYFVVDDSKVYFNADFDSGNVEKVQHLSPYVFKIHPGYDQQKNSTKKTCFHFKVYGLKMCRANFIITRMSILQKIIKANQKDIQSVPSYFPVYRNPNGQFQKVGLQVKKYYNFMGEPQLSFSFDFTDTPFVQFAFSYPYSYQQCQNLVAQLKKQYQNNSSIYFHKQILCHSKQKRNVHLITITQKQNCQNNRQENIQDLFPQIRNERPHRINKPVIFMTARVHPGESPSSYSIQGALRFVLNQKDCRSYLLRKNFQIVIIPMINPDGVFHGMFRVDLNGQNLNRNYLDCHRNKHPAIWSITKYALWLKTNKNVLFYFDFHAHPSTKNFFIYGNSFGQISLQTQAQLFGKMIESNCSVYTQKQMRVKHKHDNHSKEGCARVFMHKTFNIIHSYTVQCGYFGPTKINMVQDRQRSNMNQTRHFIQDRQFELAGQKTYTPQSYMLVGRGILITVLDLFGLNPYPKRIKGQPFNTWQMRKNHGLKIYHQSQTFKLMDASSYKRLSQLSNLIQDSYYAYKLKGTSLKLNTNQNNNLLKQQLEYLNASLRSRVPVNSVKVNKSVSLERLKSIKRNKNSRTLNSLPKLNNFKQTKYTRTTLLIGKKNQYLTAKSLIRISQFAPLNIDDSKGQQQNVSFLKIANYQVNSCHFKGDSNQQQVQGFCQNHGYKKFVQPKQFYPQTRQSKVQSTLQKSICLRKLSLKKMVFIRKDELKSLILSSLIAKKLQRQALFGSSIKIKSKQTNIQPSMNIRSKD